MLYRLTADLIVVVHAAYASFVVLGLAAILVGIARKWEWVRNLWFRLLHLLAILLVVAESLWGVMCPLTTWEQSLRTRAGQAAYRGDFIANWVHELLFFDAPPWVFTVCYTLFGMAVLATFIAAPPRWPRRKALIEPRE